MVGVFEHSAMLKLIADRCNRVVAIFSNAFLQTSLNRFLVSYAQSVGIRKYNLYTSAIIIYLPEI
jgi:myeloid differentiation primary response protein MyD88